MTQGGGGRAVYSLLFLDALYSQKLSTSWPVEWKVGFVMFQAQFKQQLA